MILSAVLEVTGLVKSFTLHNIDGRCVTALDGVDLTVGEGEHVALAGSSGAGKSSLLKCVYRTYLPSAGSVVLVGEGGERVDLLTLSEREVLTLRGRRLGYVSQFLRSPPRRTALEIVAEAAMMRGVARFDARSAAEVALDRLRLDRSLWDVHASVLSGGERQRVNLAAGTVSPPRLLLLDEPVSALDPDNRAAALDLIAGLSDAGVAVLSVFHDLDAMHRLASRVVLMRGGRVVEDGSPSEVLRHELGVAR